MYPQWILQAAEKCAALLFEAVKINQPGAIDGCFTGVKLTDLASYIEHFYNKSQGSQPVAAEPKAPAPVRVPTPEPVKHPTHAECTADSIRRFITNNPKRIGQIAAHFNADPGAVSLIISDPHARLQIIQGGWVKPA